MNKIKLFILLFLFAGLPCFVFSQDYQPVNSLTTCRNGLYHHLGPFITVYDTIVINLGFTNQILDLNIKLDTINHAFISDLDISLSHLTVNNLDLSSDNGAGGDNYIGTILNDSASISITAGTAPFTGSFRPEAPLSVFNGLNANGMWIFKIIDDGCCDIGELIAWCLVITWVNTTGGISTTEIPNTYRLSQNYPNPFNPVTTIRFGLPKAGLTRLVIYDVLANEVKTLVNEQKNAGTYEVNFDASSYPSGIYYCTLITEGYNETKKMVLIK